MHGPSGTGYLAPRTLSRCCDGGGPGRSGVLTRDTLPLSNLGPPRAEAEMRIEVKDQNLEAYGNRLSWVLEMRDIQRRPRDIICRTGTPAHRNGGRRRCRE